MEDSALKSTHLTALAGAVSFFALISAASAQSIAEDVAKGCESELKTYCSDVTPGQGRVLACLYAYQDKLSRQCEFALYDAAIRLERAVAAISYLAHECEADIEQHCASVQAGEGHILRCLQDNTDKISETCNRALGDVGLK